jgi:hypothetical protein
MMVAVKRQHDSLPASSCAVLKAALLLKHDQADEERLPYTVNEIP